MPWRGSISRTRRSCSRPRFRRPVLHVPDGPGRHLGGGFIRPAHARLHSCRRCSSTDPATRAPAPKGMLGVRSISRYFLVAGRILVDPGTPGDFDTVHALQRRIRLRPVRGEVDAERPSGSATAAGCRTAGSIRRCRSSSSSGTSCGISIRHSRARPSWSGRSPGSGSRPRGGFDPGAVARRRHGRARPRPPRRRRDRPREVAQPGRQRQWLDHQLPGAALRRRTGSCAPAWCWTSAT